MKNVIVYSKEDCQSCKATKRYLEKFEVVTLVVDIYDYPEKINHMKSKGFRSAPFVEVIEGGVVIDEWSGYKPDKIRSL